MGTAESEYLPRLGSLTPEQRVTFRVGQITRLTVKMERHVRDVLDILRGVTPTNSHSGPESFGALVAEVKALLRTANPTFIEPALIALDSARDTYHARSRFVHDYLWSVSESTWQRRSTENSYEPKHRTELDERAIILAVLDVAQCGYRMWGLAQLAVDIGIATPDAFWISMLDCRIKLLDDGTLQTTVPGHG